MRANLTTQWYPPHKRRAASLGRRPARLNRDVPAACDRGPMTWGVEDNVIERITAAGIPKEQISFQGDTYFFNFSGSPSELLE
jgi:hypothetical protein